jgi:hypothetical protein
VADTFRPELKDRVIDLAQIGKVDPAKLARQIHERTYHVEVYDLMSRLGDCTYDILAGPSTASCDDNSHTPAPTQ